MEKIVAKILINNLLSRVEVHSDGSKHLPGVMTSDEIEALKLACTLFDGIALDNKPYREEAGAEVVVTPPVSSNSSATPFRVELDTSVLNLSPAPASARVCLDFGTAMSKASLVTEEDDEEQIHVLQLGVPGDQEEVSENMLISSVYIDNEGLLWFGKAAEDRSRIEEGNGARQRLDNIKRRLSEDGLNDELGIRLDPTGQKVTYREMILAYLMFFTWAVNRCLTDIGYPRNISRRFAMPCFPNNKGRDVSHELTELLGKAQILADTFSGSLRDGLPLKDFLDAARNLDSKPNNYSFIAEGLTEPLGVANSLLSWKSPVDMLAMVVDVGAGTSDLSLYRIAVNPAAGTNMAVEVEGAARGITEAGNYLDQTLVEFILKKANVAANHPRMIPIRGRLQLEIRNLKETLFNEKYLFVSITDMDEVEIELDEFRALSPVINFGSTLRQAMQSILEEVNEDFIDWVSTNPSRYLTVVLTGGGANLPMVTELAKGEIQVNGRRVRVEPALQFPSWLRQNYPELENDYPRVAVSLGGARRTVIQSGGVAKYTGISTAPRLEGYFVTGQ